MQRIKNLNRNHGQSESMPFSTGNANAPLSTSNSGTPPSTSNTSTPEKTRATVSMRAREVKENKLPKNTTRIPASVRAREEKLRKGLLSDSSVSDDSGKPIGKSGLLTESIEDDGEIIDALSNLDSSLNEVSDTKDYSEPNLSSRNNHSHTVKTAVSSPAKTAVDPAMPSGITMLVGTILKAIDKQDWARLDNLINGMREKKLRFDDSTLRDLPAAQKIIQWAPLTVLTSNDHSSNVDHDAQWLLALDLLDLGCDWNAKDSQGNRVIDLLRKQADLALIEFVVEGFPHLKHLFSKA
jgi:hypothetical protein